MRWWVKVFLFFFAYSPLFAIFMLRYYNDLMWFTIFGIITAGSFLVLAILWHRGRKANSEEPQIIKEYIDETEYAINYIIPYLIAFLGFDLNQWPDRIALLLFMWVLYSVYSNSPRLMLVNPLLTILGYKVYSMKVSPKTSHTSKIVVSNIIVIIKPKKGLKTDKVIILRNLAAHNIFLGEITDDSTDKHSD